MKITMDMSSYEVEMDEIEAEAEEYGEEIMSTGWNPAVDLVCGLQEIQTPVEGSTSVVADIVYRKMYSYKQ